MLRLNRRWIMLGSLALVLAGSRSLWRAMHPASTALTPLQEVLPQDPAVQVFFNQSEAAVYTDPYRQIERYGDNLEQVVISSIDQATATVDVAVQALNLPRVAEALVRSARRGVQVRLILEDQYSQSGAQLDAQSEAALQILDEGNVPRLDDTADGSRGSGLMHHKFLVIDQRWVLVSSANLTLSGIHGDVDSAESRGNANTIAKIENGAIAKAFTTEFEYMWGDGPGRQLDSQFGLQKPYRSAQSFLLSNAAAGNDTVLQFSPTSTIQPWENSVNGLIAQTLSSANHSIDLALFVFSEQQIANQLSRKTRNGTALRALIDPGFVYRSYSEALDMLGVTLRDQRCKIETHNQPWPSPIATVGFPALPEGDKLHHKFAVVDDAIVIFGSQNWSLAANTQNDETLLVIKNQTVAKHFAREFDRLYRKPVLGHSQHLQQKIDKANQRCQEK